VLPTFAGTVKGELGEENGQEHVALEQTSTALEFSFFNVIVAPWAPCQPLLQTFFSDISFSPV
jgi:hypothetical protein